MTGRRLYDKYCDATAEEFPDNRGAWRTAEKPLPSWPSLSNDNRRRWNSLARKITPKRRTV